jgi:hypothetical protein
MIVAKPVIDKQFWILQENDKKIGNVEAFNGGFQVKINNRVTQFKTIKSLSKNIDIKFEPPTVTRKPRFDNIHGYPTVGRVFNPIWNINKKLPIYTKKTKSKCWFSAGFFWVKKGKEWEIMQCPKLIIIQRYPNYGPFHTREEAEKHSHGNT